MYDILENERLNSSQFEHIHLVIGFFSWAVLHLAIRFDDAEAPMKMESVISSILSLSITSNNIYFLLNVIQIQKKALTQIRTHRFRTVYAESKTSIISS